MEKENIFSIEILGNIYYFKKEIGGKITLIMEDIKADHVEFYSVAAEKETDM